MRTTAVILAAGKGTRMKSQLPKVLHKVGEQTLLAHVLSAAEPLLDATAIAVIGHGGEEIQQALGDRARVVWQHEQLGTGHAVMQARNELQDADQVMVLCGDTPLLRTETLKALLDTHLREKNGATVLTVSMENPTGYGRIVKDASGQLEQIVEEKDCTQNQRAIAEINSGAYCFERNVLVELLDQLRPDNAQGEYYLTDVIRLLRREGGRTGTHLAHDPDEIMGVNDRVQLALAEKILRNRTNRHWLEMGVTMLDPDHTYIGQRVRIEPDVMISPGVILEGDTRIGAGTVLGPGCRLTDAIVGRNCRLDQSIVMDSCVGDGCLIGPFAYIRPGCVLEDRVKIGDFVEIKKTSVGAGSKLPHHSYVGDAQVGSGVNIGAGTITCNYDGVSKHQTVIEDEVFVGSNSNLVAPVRLGKRAYVAAGSTITEDVPPESLGLGRSKQKNIQGWRRKKGI